MNKVDIRFKKSEMELLQSLIGQEIQSISHDAFLYVNSSSQIVQINSDNDVYYLYSFTEPLNYLGSTEDVAIWSFETRRYPAVDNKNFIQTPFMEKVKSISVVQENQRLYRNNEQIYDLWLTRALIFNFEERQLSFEKAIWFSEDIYIRRGYNLIHELAPVDNFINNDWDDTITAECSRKVIKIH